MSLAAIFLALTLLTLLILLVLMLRAGVARPMAVWSLAALMPLLGAMTVALNSQAQAKKVLAGYQADDVAVVIQTDGQEYDTVLNPQQAACLERTMRLHNDANLVLPDETDPIPLRANTRVAGELPKKKFVEALGIRGQLSCPEFRHVSTAKDGEKKDKE